MTEWVARASYAPVRFVRRFEGELIVLAFVAAVATGIFFMIWGVMANARGDYAGQHYGDALSEATDVMALKYGAVFAASLRLGVPDVVNTHVKDSILIGNGQVRVFHMVGPRGVHYCVRLWSSGTLYREANAVVKGCSFTTR